MLRLSTVLILTLMILSVITGCSSHRTNPVLPSNTEIGLPADLSSTDYDKTGHALLGYWTIEFDLESMTATAVPNRDLNAHLNIL
jgi:hypothetical protein